MIRDRVQTLEDHLQAAKRRLNEFKTGKPAVRYCLLRHTPFICDTDLHPGPLPSILSIGHTAISTSQFPNKLMI